MERQHIKNHDSSLFFSESEIIITLTTISQRIESSIQTIKSLIHQNTDRNFSVILNISKEPYLLDKGIEKIPSNIAEEENKNKNFFINYVENTGPYRKLLPTLEWCIKNKKDPYIITCDDDTIYPDNFIETLLLKKEKTWGIVAFRGYTIKTNNKEILRYKDWQNSEKLKHSILNIPTGKDGVLYQKDHFHPNVLDKSAFIKVCPKTDDIWLKWHTAIKNIPVLLVNTTSQDLPNNTDVDMSTSLFSAFNKKGGNDISIEAIETFFENTYGHSLKEKFFSISEHKKNKNLQLSTSKILKKANEELRNGNYARSEQLYFLFSNRNPNLRPLSELNLIINERRKNIQGEPKCYAQNTYANHIENQEKNTNNNNQLEEKKVSVIITSYNSQDTIEECVLSIINQSYKNIEVIVCDDNSKDKTWAILGRLAEKHTCLKIFQLRKNSGTYLAKNLGITESTGEVIMFQDSDDSSHPERLKIQAQHLLQNPSKIANRTKYLRYDEETNKIINVSENPSKYGFITLAVRKKAFDEIGYFDAVRKGGDDEWFQRLRHFYDKENISDVNVTLYLARLREKSLISDMITYNSDGSVQQSSSSERKKYAKIAQTRFKEKNKRWFKNNFKPFPLRPNRVYPDKIAALEQIKEKIIVNYKETSCFSHSSIANLQKIEAQADATLIYTDASIKNIPEWIKNSPRIKILPLNEDKKTVSPEGAIVFNLSSNIKYSLDYIPSKLK